MIRPSIDDVLMTQATIWKDRSTCDRKHVGVVIAQGGRTIGSGYNGAPAGMPHCEHIGFLPYTYQAKPSLSPIPPRNTATMDRGCKIAIHAEANALAYAARHGVSVEGATLYTTLSPCYACSQLIIAAGLSRVAYDESYRDPAGIDLLRSGGVVVSPLRKP